MASSSSVLSEDELQCSICLDVFTDPVSTPCGHNFCKVCLRKYWDTSSHCRCPLCKEDFHNRPELRVNTFISGLAAQFKKSVQVKSSIAADPLLSMTEKVLCDSCIGEKLEAVKSCLHCGVSLCSAHLLFHKTTAKFKRHKLIDPVENLEDYICQKHERPLELFCRDDQTCVCQFCTEGEHKTHNIVPIEEESVVKKCQLGETQAAFQQMIQKRLKKIKEVKESEKLNKMNTEKEKAESMAVFSALMRCIEKSQAEMLKVIDEEQKAAEMQAEEFIKHLQYEITELKRRNTELEQISRTEDHLHLLQIYPTLCSPPRTKYWADVTINSYLCLETLRTQLQESLNEEMEKFPEIKLKSIQRYAVAVTLDPNTANFYLVLSDDGKQVRCGQNRHRLRDNAERFNYCACVLGKERFPSGKFYYEVEVRGKTEWDLGVARKSVNRKGTITLTPENGFWSVLLRNGTEYKAGERPLVPLSLKQAPQKVGVFVDYEEGLVSFYDVDAKSHIYSFTDQCFFEDLYPYFSPGHSYVGENSAPLFLIKLKLMLKTQTDLFCDSEHYSVRNMGAPWSCSVETNEPGFVSPAHRPTIPTKQERQVKKTHLEKIPEEVKVIQNTQKDTGKVRNIPKLKKDWTNKHTVEMLRRALSQLLESLNKEMDKYADSDLKRNQQHAVDVTLDPDTAHPELILSHDGKQVRHGDLQQDLPDNPERFNLCVCVLGKEGFSSGRFYYEVQVREKTKWDLGVARESVKRQEKIITSPTNGYWTMWLRHKTEYEACDSPPVPLSLKQAPQKVGVFVDYEEGLISFYDVDAKSLIYSFTGQTFTEKLYPFFSPSRNYSGKNSAPLIIMPVIQST
ncbi:E3 ubiquitin-protein ligase TRIM39 [Ictalurus punctatus]|uniref:E3 ubiquitin-protein ligase TRIM39 n=1 Tax=Ictalurus punctatus TaxID=7998 RepID=A0A9F7RJS7_ICTPU|nr:E3 ubiquitin-protein ligase TRIM39 [Ictalurus punctatus]